MSVRAYPTFSRLPRFALAATTMAVALALSACAVGPDYTVPEQDLGVAFQEQSMPGWTVAQTADHLPREAWWTLYDDAILDDLMEQLGVGNQTVVQAEANYRAAMASLRQARAAYFPTVSATAGRTRSRTAAGTADINRLQGDLSWEVDIWGRVRRSVEANDAAALSSAAIVANTRFSQQSTLAQTYFQLRIADERQALLRRTLDTYERSLTLTRNRYEAGLVQRLETTLAENQLETARASLLESQQQRMLLENAIAQLLGLPP